MLGLLFVRFYNINPELTEIPEHIIRCYTDGELWNRYQRLPSSIDSLVAIIRYNFILYIIVICILYSNRICNFYLMLFLLERLNYIKVQELGQWDI